MTKLDFIATAEQTGERIDRFLSAQDTGLTRSAVQKLIEDGGVTVGGKKVSKNLKAWWCTLPQAIPMALW